MKSKLKSITPMFVLGLLIAISPLYAQTTQNKPSQDSIYYPFQLSFVPYVGTSGLASNKVTCDISINLLAGTVKNVRSVEIGGLLNMVQNNSSSCQLSGFGNLVGGTATGLQGAGMFNMAQRLNGVQAAGTINVAGEATGIQLAGLVNHASKGNSMQIAGWVNNASESAVFQISGMVNITPKNDQFQIAGLVNHARTAKGFQLAGLVNNVTDSTGFQLAGLVNNAKVTEFQIAGLANNAATIHSLQAAGLVNNAKEVSGVQVSGLVNHAKIVNGLQIGVINIADSCNGIPIGVINLVKNGYHKLEISGDEMFYANVAFHSGVQKLHSIVVAGMQPSNFNSVLWTYGVGLGSAISLNDKSALDIDAIFQHVMKEDHVGNNYLYKFAVGIDRQLWNKTSLYLGVTYNFLVTDTRYSQYADKYSSIAPYHFTDHTFGNGFNLKTWLGFKLGLRFL